ncbi:uncharacterized protein [Lolium perenne]|uniref:uncharacterized protein n=1 Tax=Lolium perenne TaxID=4522 RepID=UPI003A999F01
MASSTGKSKKFEARWLQEDSFREVVEQAWAQAGNAVSDGGVLARLSHMHSSLHEWDNDILKKPKQRLKTAQRKLERAMQGPLTEENDTIAKEQSALIELLLEQDEVHWMQRSRANWLRNGDRNTAFFHQFASARRQKNQIKRLKNGINWVEGTSALKPIILQYFTDLFSSEINEVDPAVLNKVTPRVTSIMNDKLLAPFSADDVKKAAFSIGDLKAPGPDGLHAIFYKRFWSICGDDITSEVLLALNSGVIPDGWNDTTIVLILKVDNPESISQYRPISLCNADTNNATSLQQVLDTYCANSGQLVSLAKSSIFFSPNTNVLTRAEICEALHITTEAISDKYLGLPALVGADRSDSFEHFIERIIQRINGWKEKQLSIRGKEILLKAVAQAIPVYAMSVFLIPKGVCKKMMDAIASFWWGDDDNSNKMHWHIGTSGQCPVCMTAPEDVLHLLFQCIAAREVWTDLGIQSIIDEAISVDRSGSAVLEFLLRDQVKRATGVVARDHDGSFLAAAACFFTNVATAAMTEALAMREGLALANRLGCNNVLMESDSSETVNACLQMKVLMR